ncbi:MAG: hypothetical protein AAF203_08220 [Pseudomonadota bacterium]
MRFIHFSMGVLFALSVGSLSYASSSTVETSYGEVANEIHRQMNAELAKIYRIDCGGQPNSKRTPSRYRCGEIPFGRILNGKHKQIFKFDIRRGRKKNLSRGGFVNLNNNVSFPVLMERNQSFSHENISMIDFKKPIDVVMSNRIDKNLFIRMTPKKNELTSLACTYIPGFRSVVPRRTLHLSGKAKTKVKFIFSLGTVTTNFSGSAHVNVGDIRVKNIKVCGVFKTKLIGAGSSSIRPVTSLVSLSYPKLNNLSVNGLKVHVFNVRKHNKGVLGAIANVLDTFGIIDVRNIVRNELEKGVRQEVSRNIRISTNDIRNGNWFKKAINTEVAKAPFKRNIIASFRSAINRSTSGVKVFEEKVDSQCFAGFRDIERQTGARLDDEAVEQFCEDLTVRVRVSPFTRKANFQQRGCYNHFFTTDGYARPNRKRINPNWKTQCKLTTDISIDGPSSLTGSRKCLLDGFIAGRSEADIVNRCRNTVIRDFVSLRSLSELQRVVRAADPESTLRSLGLTSSAATRVAQVLGL